MKTIRERVEWLVENDPITKADRRAMKQPAKPAGGVTREYDLDYPAEITKPTKQI